MPPRLDGRIELLRVPLAQRVARPAGLTGVPVPEAQPRPAPKGSRQVKSYKIRESVRYCWSAQWTKRGVPTLISPRALLFDVVAASYVRGTLRMKTGPCGRNDSLPRRGASFRLTQKEANYR